MTIRRISPLLPAFALLGILFAVACGPADEHGKEKDQAQDHATEHTADSKTPKPLKPAPTATAGPVNERGERLYTYDAELLLASRRTNQWVVDMPVVTQALAETQGHVVAAVQISIECANEATYKELESKKETFTKPISDAIEKKTIQWLRTPQGKMRLKEEIIYNYRRSPLLEHDQIREVYFRALVIQAGR